MDRLLYSVSEVRLESFCHITEDPKRVESAILNLLPENLRDNVQISKEVLKGYYGNRIIHYTVRLFDEHAAETLIFISNSIGSLDKRLIRSTFDLRVEGSRTLYLRFDKGRAFEGILSVSQIDYSIKMRVKFRVKRSEEMFNLCRDLGLIVGDI